MTRPHAISSSSPVARARPSTSSLRPTRRPSTSSWPSTATGLVRKRSTIVRSSAGCSLAAYSRTTSRLRRTRVSASSGVSSDPPCGIDDHRRVRERGELAQLGRGVGRLGRAATAEDHDLADGSADELVQRMVGDVGLAQLGLGQHQHAGDVQRDVAVADHDGPMAGQVEVMVGAVGMPVVPGDEVGGRLAAVELLAGDVEASPDRRARRVDDRVEVLEQVLVGDDRTDLDAAVEAEARMRSRLLVALGDLLDLRVIRRDAGAHEAPWRREAVEQVDLDAFDGEQAFRGVEAGGPGPYHRDACLDLLHVFDGTRVSRERSVRCDGTLAAGPSS